MNRQEFFLAAMRAEEYKRTAWVISAFSLTAEAPDAWMKDPYPYRIVQTPSGFYYVNPDDTTQLIIIPDMPMSGMPLFRMKDQVMLKAGDVPNLKTDVGTTYGNILFNWIVLVYPFGEKIPFALGRVNANALEAILAEKLRDNPAKLEDRDQEHIYVDEYLKFTSAMFSLSAYTQLCVPACTAKTITPPPGIIELRTRLLDENRANLHDPAVIAKIDKELIAYMKDWMKDDEGMGFLISEKSFSNVRRKLYLMGGAEAGMEDGTKVALVERSLSEGWDPINFPIMNTASRSGSFSRGALTELGGEATKWLFRASSNMTVAEEDCGSRLGVAIVAQPGQERRLVGFTALIGDTSVKITSDNVGEYLGKRMILRSPMYCKSEKTDFCATCVGERLSTSPTGLSTAIADYGSTFMTVSMKSMHDSSVKVAKMNVPTFLM